MSEANRQLVYRWFEQVWNQKSEAAIDEMYSLECRSYGFPNPDTALVGPEAFKGIHRNFLGAFPDTHITVDDVITEGDKFAARWTVTMTHLGDNMGIAPTGKKVKLTGSSIGVIKDGQMVEGWNHMDMGHLYGQLGIGH